ncbi:MAG: protoporphyrinogen oxidase HemJ [Gammaproteobacteria bacterium]|nr:protoporphyrinogen oxidase HemJ [Gammaproteobacteria bacterium]MBL6999558.1 protoporphyrinogen oxidase HemJ [Gammaproteobacteria bacterium]
MLWPKALHLVFMVAWFAGLFYLPRLFVNHAMTEHKETREQFKIMERKLYRFTTPWMVLTLIFGFWMLYDYAWAAYGSMLWLHIKLMLMIILVVYHFYCGKLVKDFAADRNKNSHVWYRYFNEVPAIVLFIMIPLAVLKPF